MKKILRNLYFGVEPYLFAPLSFLLRSDITHIGRSLIAQKYLTGVGLEIGAFVSPTLVPIGAKVKYVDRVPASHWRDDPEYQGFKPVEPDIIDDGALLTIIPDNSVNYVMCFQMLEHCPNAMEAVKNWIRVTKPSGIVIIGIPDKRFTRDNSRKLTPWSHFVCDFENGPEWSSENHYRDVAKNILNLSGDELENFMAEAPPAIHFHIWDIYTFFSFLHNTNTYFGAPIEIIQVMMNHHEIIAVLQKKSVAPQREILRTHAR